MPVDDFMREITPMVCEIISMCLKMSDEAYQEYKADVMSAFNEQKKPEAVKFMIAVFRLVESYRNKKRKVSICAQRQD